MFQYNPSHSIQGPLDEVFKVEELVVVLTEHQPGNPYAFSPVYF